MFLYIVHMSYFLDLRWLNDWVTAQWVFVNWDNCLDVYISALFALLCIVLFSFLFFLLIKHTFKKFQCCVSSGAVFAWFSNAYCHMCRLITRQGYSLILQTHKNKSWYKKKLEPLCCVLSMFLVWFEGNIYGSLDHKYGILAFLRT